MLQEEDDDDKLALVFRGYCCLGVARRDEATSTAGLKCDHKEVTGKD